MKINIQINENIEDVNIDIVCPQLTAEIERILAAIRMLDHQLTGTKNGETYLIDIRKIIYIESVDRQCFLYTEKNIYETNSKLYELEQQLNEFGFIRINKSTLINLQKIQSLKAEINRKIRITLCNKEQIIASRKYADELKKRIGVK